MTGFQRLLPLLLLASCCCAGAQGLAGLAATDHIQIEETSKPIEWRGAGYTVKMNRASLEEIRAYGLVLSKEWGLYPASLIGKVHLHRIEIGKDLAMNGQLRAAVPAFDGDTMYYDAVLGSTKTHYQRIVIHHEFFHMVDERMGLLRVDPEWEKLNPPTFHYGSGGEHMRTKGVGELTDRFPGFLTEYGTASLTEDKAELFAHLIVDGAYVLKQASTDAVLARKIELLKRRLSAFDAEMGAAFWERAKPGSKTYLFR